MIQFRPRALSACLERVDHAGGGGATGRIVRGEQEDEVRCDGTILSEVPMSHGTEVTTVDGGGGEVMKPSTAAPTLIKWTSRLGVWGLAGGFLPVIAFSLGAPVSLPTAIAAMAGGFVVGGLGTTVALVLAARQCPPEARALRLAAALGMPMGLIFATVGVSTFFGWQIVGSLGGITMAGLGVVVLVLLIAGFMKYWSEDRLDPSE